MGSEAGAALSPELELELERLSLSPGMEREREDVAPGVRSFPVASHVVFYAAGRGGVIVLRLLHPSMDVDLAFSARDSRTEP